MSSAPEDQNQEPQGLMGEFFQFLKNEKKWWLFPLIFLVVALVVVVVFFSGDGMPPFMYPFF